VKLSCLSAAATVKFGKRSVIKLAAVESARFTAYFDAGIAAETLLLRQRHLLWHRYQVTLQT